MNFSIQTTIRDLVAPNRHISFSVKLWFKGLEELKRRSGGFRESGAFLLGKCVNDVRHIQHFVYYDDLDPHCLDKGIIIFDGTYYRDLWKICRDYNMDVLADVHTHPGHPIQSFLDQSYPMISKKGHIAIIVPHFAKKPVKCRHLGVYEYQGNQQWHSIVGRKAAKYLYIGI